MVRRASIAAGELAAALEEAAESTLDPITVESLRRSLAILRSRGDGQEVSDTAWPHFILPESEEPARRRLLAAAATVLSGEGLIGSDQRRQLVSNPERAALRALTAAVNGD